MPRFDGTLDFAKVLKDPSLVEGLTKACEACDPWTPHHQERESCTTCLGTGEEPLSFHQIALEINDSMTGNDKKPRKNAEAVCL
jgi:hypothetical protein